MSRSMESLLDVLQWGSMARRDTPADHVEAEAIIACMLCIHYMIKDVQCSGCSAENNGGLLHAGRPKDSGELPRAVYRREGYHFLFIQHASQAVIKIQRQALDCFKAASEVFVPFELMQEQARRASPCTSRVGCSSQSIFAS